MLKDCLDSVRVLVDMPDSAGLTDCTTGLQLPAYANTMIRMVVRMVAMALPASLSVPNTNFKPLLYLITLKMRTKPMGLEAEALLVPSAGNKVAAEATARTASATFQ